MNIYLLFRKWEMMMLQWTMRAQLHGFFKKTPATFYYKPFHILFHILHFDSQNSTPRSITPESTSNIYYCVWHNIFGKHLQKKKKVLISKCYKLINYYP